MLNYLALLGWAIADDRDIFTLAEMVAAFDISRCLGNPARFDPKKAEAINAAHMRLLTPEDFAGACEPYLVDAGVLERHADLDAARAAPAAAARWSRSACVVLSDAAGMLRFLFVAEDGSPSTRGGRAKVLGPGRRHRCSKPP